MHFLSKILAYINSFSYFCRRMYCDNSPDFQRSRFPEIQISRNPEKTPTIMKDGFLFDSIDYKQLLFYKKTVILYDLTFFFKEKYLLRTDRTQDQMEQAARSAKQNIVEGLTDGMTSMEMAIKLLNVARGSLMELLEDYEDYLRVHGLKQWDVESPRHIKMRNYTYRHADVEAYRRYFERWDAEALCNLAITLSHQADRAMYSYLKKMESSFMKDGGIRERMSAARRQSRGY